MLANIGAYSCFPTTCAVEPLMAMAEMPGPYDVRDYACHARGVVTNTCPMAPYRGVSRPVITFALERLMDKSAATLGIDPVELRRRNLITKFPYTSAMGLVFDDATYLETMELAVEALDIPAFRKRQSEARAQGRYLGLGISTFSERTGYGTPAFAARGMEITPGLGNRRSRHGPVRPRRSAHRRFAARAGAADDVVADHRRSSSASSPAQVSVIHGDTDRTPYGWGTFASRSLVISGGASLLAARKVRGKLLQIAGRLLEASADDIELEEGVARVEGHRPRDPDRAGRARGLSSRASVLRSRSRPVRKRELRSGRHLLQCLPCRDRRGRYRDRRGDDRTLSSSPRMPAA